MADSLPGDFPAKAGGISTASGTTASGLEADFLVMTCESGALRMRLPVSCLPYFQGERIECFPHGSVPWP